jgi:hypothetical protein
MKSNINKKTILFGLLSLLLLVTACKKALDINQDPNNPSLDQGNPRLVFPAAAMATAGMEGGDIAILGGMWSEYFTQSALANQYKFIDAYDVKSTDLNTQYSGLFTGGLKNFQFVIDKAKDAQDWNSYLMGEVMKAYTAGLLVDLYDKMPYSEALGGSSNLNPHFDNGDAIYADLIAGIDSAMTKDFTASSNSAPGTSDLVFGGDMDKWKRFANTMELKLYLRMVNMNETAAQSGIQRLYTNGAEFLQSDAGIFGFTDVPGQDNPLYEQNIRQLNTPNNLRASRTFVSWLEEKNDPRIVSYFGTNAPNSIHQGDYLGTDPTYASAAVFIQSPTDPVIFISAAESYFLQAEARERYFSGDQAGSLYNQGVLASFVSVGQDGSSFITGAYKYPTGSLEQKIEAIVTQKWASFAYGVHFIEGFFRKTKNRLPRYQSCLLNRCSYVSGQFVVSKILYCHREPSEKTCIS